MSGENEFEQTSEEIVEESSAPEQTSSRDEPVLSGVGPRKRSAKGAGGIEIAIPEDDIVEESKAIHDFTDATTAKVYGEEKQKNHFVVEEGEKAVIWMALDMTCTIGGKVYSFEKDKKYRVSKNIKDVLLTRGALKAI